MAGKSYLSKPNYRFFSQDIQTRQNPIAPAFEFDESDLWNSHSPQPQNQSEFKNTIPSSRISKNSMKNKEKSSSNRSAEASSLPLNIPDWSKVGNSPRRDVKSEFGDNGESGESDGDGDGVRIPPHEFLAKQLARKGVPSFSVHEGVGRKLKGRDLSRVRNAIWQKTGFAD